MTDGRPYDFINIAFKAELLLAGYAVVSMDFRGTGEQYLLIVLTRQHVGHGLDSCWCSQHCWVPRSDAAGQ